MKFRTRITLGYAALALAISLGLGMFYNMYIIQKYETAAFNQFGILSEQMLNNLDENIQKMTQVTLSLLSDQDAVQTIRELSVDMADPEDYMADIVNGKARLKRDLYTAYNLENFIGSWCSTDMDISPPARRCRSGLSMLRRMFQRSPGSAK